MVVRGTKGEKKGRKEKRRGVTGVSWISAEKGRDGERERGGRNRARKEMNKRRNEREKKRWKKKTEQRGNVMNLYSAYFILKFRRESLKIMRCTNHV